MINSYKVREKVSQRHLNTKTPCMDWGLQVTFSIFRFIFIRLFCFSLVFLLLPSSPLSIFDPFASYYYTMCAPSLSAGCQPFSASTILPSTSLQFTFYLFSCSFLFTLAFISLSCLRCQQVQVCLCCLHANKQISNKTGNCSSAVCELLNLFHVNMQITVCFNQVLKLGDLINYESRKCGLIEPQHILKTS